jgi:hypothetical protein
MPLKAASPNISPGNKSSSKKTFEDATIRKIVKKKKKSQ